MEYKETVIFDFDGVIHSYSSGWMGVTTIPDPPVPGIREAINEIRAAGYKVVILSTRCNQRGGIGAIIDYLKKHDIIVDDVIRNKVPAILQIDDRAICFDGDAGGLLKKIKEFTPWNKKNIS